MHMGQPEVYAFLMLFEHNKLGDNKLRGTVNVRFGCWFVMLSKCDLGKQFFSDFCLSLSIKVGLACFPELLKIRLPSELTFLERDFLYDSVWCWQYSPEWFLLLTTHFPRLFSTNGSRHGPQCEEPGWQKCRLSRAQSRLRGQCPTTKTEKTKTHEWPTPLSVEVLLTLLGFFVIFCDN